MLQLRAAFSRSTISDWLTGRDPGPKRTCSPKAKLDKKVAE
jgi:hypothetical protein